MNMPVSVLPAFWFAFAGFCILIAAYLAIFAYKRNRGEKIYFPMESLGFWLDERIFGKKGRETLRKQVEKDQRRNRVMVTSAVIGSIGSLLMAIFSILTALLLK